MLNYSRNKLVSVEINDNDSLSLHGVLDDDIYGLEINVNISISKLEILSIEGKWNRWTTSECPRSIPFLKEAVGIVIEDGFADKIHKSIGRKSCRHFANLLIECCFSAKETIVISEWLAATKTNPELSFEEFYENKTDNGDR